MGTQDKAGLSQRFTDLCNAFNNASENDDKNAWKTVSDMLVDDVVLTTLDSPTTIINKGRVTAYIKTKIAKDHPGLSRVQPHPDPDPTTGIVAGTAFWSDNDSGVPTNRKITFKFVFSWENNDWYVVSLSGSPD
jgi:hypothetical protein